VDDGANWLRVMNDPATSMAFTAKPADTYKYEVRACKGTVCDDKFSKIAVITVVVPPELPELDVPGADANGSYSVGWTIAGNDPESYFLDERPSGSSTWTTFELSGITASKAFTGKVPGVYEYQLRACNGSACSANTGIGAIVVLGTPVMHSLTSPNSTGDYTVAWDTVPGLPWYRLYESTDDGASWTLVQNLPTTSMAFADKALKTYQYKVRSCKGAVCDDTYSSVKAITIVAPPKVPTLDVDGADADGSYSVSWSSTDQPATYQLDARVNGGAWTTTVLGGTVASKSYSGKVPAVYDYQLRACIGTDCSNNSPIGTLVVLGTPVMKTLASSSTTGNYTVGWNSVPGDPWYRLYESNDGGANWTRVQNSTALSMTFSNKADGTYKYEVRACKGAVCDDTYSSIKTITVDKPGTLRAESSGTRTRRTGSAR
jgi:hypothetical protein